MLLFAYRFISQFCYILSSWYQEYFVYFRAFIEETNVMSHHHHHYFVCISDSLLSKYLMHQEKWTGKCLGLFSLFKFYFSGDRFKTFLGSVDFNDWQRGEQLIHCFGTISLFFVQKNKSVSNQQSIQIFTRSPTKFEFNSSCRRMVKLLGKGF